MSDELRRILGLVKDGKLTEDQAASLIEALDEDHEDANAGGRENRRHSRGARRGRRHRKQIDNETLEEFGVTIGKEVASIVDKSLKGLSTVLAGKSGPTTWLNESNVNVMSKLHTPTGENYECSDNNFTVSRFDDVNLSNSSLSDNEMHAGSIKDFSLSTSHFKGNELRGSSLKGVRMENGELTNCQFNGAQVASVSIEGGKLDDCSFNGANIRDLNIEGGSLSESLFNGAKFGDVTITGDAHVKDLTVNGSKAQDMTIESSDIDKLQLNGVNMHSVRIEHSVLNNVAFRNRQWRDYIGYTGRLPSPTINELLLTNFRCSDTKFLGCVFENTQFKDCEISGLTFTDVDFSGRTLDTSQAFLDLADQNAA